METPSKTRIVVECTIQAPVEKIWALWTTPADIMKWNNASDDWHTPQAENDLRPGGRFVYHMAAKDGSVAFDFGGTYLEVKPLELITYTMDDNRHVGITFTNVGTEVNVVETFEAESINPVDLQRSGWQSILNNFKNYVETTLVG